MPAVMPAVEAATDATAVAAAAVGGGDGMLRCVLCIFVRGGFFGLQYFVLLVLLLLKDEHLNVCKRTRTGYGHGSILA